MKLKLKNKEKKIKLFSINKNIFTKKNLFLFLFIYLLIGLIFGIIFFIYLNSNDKNMIKESITSYFQIKESYKYIEILKENTISNLKNIFIIWILGISIIGIIIILFLLFCEIFSIGFTISSIIYTYKIKGFVAIISYLFPSKLIYILLLLLICYYALICSVKIIKIIFYKKQENNKININKYIKVLIIFILLGIICSICETFITPFMIKFFTFIK